MNKNTLAVFFVLLMSAIFSLKISAATDSEELAKAHQAYTAKGADTCLSCHDEDNEYPVMPIFKGPHGQPFGEKAPFNNLQCESCHGPGQAHAKKAKRSDDVAGTIIHFGKNSTTSIELQNEKCIDCHQDTERGHWPGSAHQQEDLTCVSCHQIHVAKDPVMQPTTQTKVCLSCHTRQRAELHKRSVHSMQYDQLQCSSCHQPHGSTSDKLLVKSNLNETCYSCHAEKRGPFLWQHAPVDEDCGLCHVPHGSNQVALLKKRTQLLCRECHSPAGHPSLSPSATSLPGGRHSGIGKFVVGKNCLNCHSQIHGSNHPSGAKLTR
ncbi:MAG: DmsE family decaheme c-type cytochrome [Kangiellaceae bacterium]|nr:DmsE family decaheme c-type cytochrome [Kangiellaceae bacterium]